jgi:hypothetical protein
MVIGTDADLRCWVEQFRDLKPLTPCMPWTVCRLYGCRLMAFAQVGRQAEGSVGDRGCPLVSAGACPRYAPSRDLLGRAEPETSIPGGILAEPAAVEGVRTWVESLEDIGCNQARRAAPGRHRPSPVQLISPRPRRSGRSPRRCRRRRHRCSDRSLRAAAAPPEAAGNRGEAPRPGCRPPGRR